MPLESTRLRRITQSASNVSTQRVRELRAAGRDVIGLTIGEPDFPTPPNVLEAASRAMARGETRYTTVDGTEVLKEAVRAKFRRDNRLEFASGEITVANGAKQVVFNALMATVSAGDEVIVPAPCWVSYIDMVRLADGVPVVVRCEETAGFRLSPEQLDAAIGPRTRWLILNSPGNPTGAMYDRDHLRSLAAVLARHPHVLVLSDDIYEHLRFDGREFATIAEVEPGLRERALTVNGVSKAYAMTGWRIGYAGGPRPIIGAMAKLQSHSTSSPCSISQAAAAEALSGPQDLLGKRAAEYQRRRDLAMAALSSTPGLSCARPDGTFYVFPRCDGVLGKRRPDDGRVIATERDFVDFLIDRGVAGIPGDAYGASPYVRFSTAVSVPLLEEALGRVRRACEALSA